MHTHGAHWAPGPGGHRGDIRPSLLPWGAPLSWEEACVPRVRLTVVRAQPSAQHGMIEVVQHRGKDRGARAPWDGQGWSHLGRYGGLLRGGWVRVCGVGDGRDKHLRQTKEHWQRRECGVLGTSALWPLPDCGGHLTSAFYLCFRPPAFQT